MRSWIRIHLSEVRIRGSGSGSVSAPKCHRSSTLVVRYFHICCFRGWKKAEPGQARRGSASLRQDTIPHLWFVLFVYQCITGYVFRGLFIASNPEIYLETLTGFSNDAAHLTVYVRPVILARGLSPSSNGSFRSKQAHYLLSHQSTYLVTHLSSHPFHYLATHLPTEPAISLT
jgi:hypothetical protein